MPASWNPARDPYATERARMVERLRSSVQCEDPRILEAFGQVPRHLFVPESQREHAYEDRALPLGDEQTISQPSMIAIMLAALRCEPGDRALEIGSGSGYAAALLAELVGEVYAVEILPSLAARGRATLAQLGQDRVHVHVGDGRRGLPEHAPYRRILVSAGTASVPEALLAQLAPGGRIAIPVGNDWGQTLMVGEKDARGQVSWAHDVPCMFVPLVSARSEPSDT